MEPVELALALQDDYGVTVHSFDSINVGLRIIDASTGSILQSASATVNSHSGAFPVHTSTGPFHQLKVALTIAKEALPTSIRFELSVEPEAGDDGEAEISAVSQKMLDFVGEGAQTPVNSWDGHRLIFLRVLSGNVALKAGSATEKSFPKVQTAFRRLYLPKELSPPSSFSVLERPGLNNSTGQRLWDCSIGLSLYMTLHPHSLFPTTRNSVSPPPSKRHKLESPRQKLQVMELGAGCGLVALVASHLLQSTPEASNYECQVIATDVAVTVDTTLKENLEENGSTLNTARILDWGALSDQAVLDAQQASSPGKRPHLVLVAADVLYNPASHSLLLDTILSFFRCQTKDDISSKHALLAYKARTSGDDGFFSLASEAGLLVDEVWQWGDIAVYRLTPAVTD